MTKKITAAVAVAYSVLYVALAYALFSESILSMDYSSLSTTQGLSKAFSEATSVLAGWAHFIVFDLWTARYFVLDSGRSGIPHLAVVPAILGCMFFGPRRSPDLPRREEGVRVEVPAERDVHQDVQLLNGAEVT
jgi:hypothetical protein